MGEKVVGSVSGTMEEMSEFLGIDLAKHMVEGQQIGEEDKLRLQKAWENTPWITTVQDYDQEARNNLENVRRLGIKYERREAGEAIYYDIYLDDVEIGCWSFDIPRRGFGGGVMIGVNKVALGRGVDTSIELHGDCNHIPDDERRRTVVFMDLTRQLRSGVSWMNDMRNEHLPVRDDEVSIEVKYRGVCIYQVLQVAVGSHICQSIGREAVAEITEVLSKK